VGDSVLVQLTELVSKHIREEDILARYGGEEFAIILHDIKPHTGIKIANSIRTRIERHPFIINNHKTAKLTISIGAVTYGTNYSSFDEMVIAADKALYEAKETGRNRVVNY
jgi:diguanylate cyclase (GGDEF)-like protein